MREDQIQPPEKRADSTNEPDQPPEKPPFAPVSANQITPNEISNGPRTDQNRRKRKSLSRFELWMVVLSAVGIIVATGTGLAIVWQDIIANASLVELQKQYPEVKKSADAAESAATTAENALKSSGESFRQEERAYLWAISFNMSSDPIITDAKGERVCADVHIANSGKTPANGVHIWRYATFGPNAERTIRSFRPPKYLAPSGDMLGTTGDKWGTAFTGPVDKGTETALLDGSIPLYVYGVVQYFDVFGKYHETGFCSQRVRKGTPFIVCDGFGNWFDKRPGDNERAN